MLQQITRAHIRTRVLTTLIGFSIGGTGASLAQANADWHINLPTSNLSFNTTKSGMAGVGGITETMRFKNFKGGLTAQGLIELTIDLSSIDSGIGIRDERLQTMFWNVVSHPTVKFSGQLSAQDMKKISMGKESLIVTVDGQLTMNGQVKPIQAQLQVAPINNKLHVSTRQAVVINANDFGLTAGAEALRSIMGLNYLSTSAPVSFSFELNTTSGQNMVEQKLPPSAW